MLIDELLARNLKFVENSSPNFDFLALPSLISNAQSPHTVVVCCSDSRVTPEFIFQCEIGELFVVRTAVNILDSISFQSVDFAVT